ncbi:MAG: hypothetical protein V4548_01300 [Bacteroidota bacterium]
MKKLICFLCIITFLGCKSKKGVSETKNEPTKEIATLEKLSIPELETGQKNKAYELGKRVLMTCNTSRFKAFNSNEATESVIKNTTQDRLTKTCLKFKLRYGDFIDLKLMEVYKNNDKKTIIYRYKALYEKKIANKELRVTVNEENKIAGIQSLDWVDLYK